jgi:hypothetical protein
MHKGRVEFNIDNTGLIMIFLVSLAALTPFTVPFLTHFQLNNICSVQVQTNDSVASHEKLNFRAFLVAHPTVFHVTASCTRMLPDYVICDCLWSLSARIDSYVHRETKKQREDNQTLVYISYESPKLQ